MEFKKYHSIENSYRKKTIDAIIEQELDKGDYIVQEKAHGANLSFWYDGEKIKSAKRTGFITDDFYDFESVEKKYSEYIIDLHKILKDDGYDFEILVIYGELIGGTYPHKDVLKDTSATRIQKGIFYTPHNDFYAIDMTLDGQLQDIDTFTKYMEKRGFLYAKTLFKGSLSDCLNYPNKFQSQIHKWIGLPEIEDNCCEGTVIKPVKPLFFRNTERVILKNKNEKWAEKARKKKRPPKAKPVFSDEVKRLSEELYSFVTKNRLRNVLSKIGSIQKSEFGKLMKEFSKDCIEDFNKDHSTFFNQLEKKEQKYITTNLNKACSNLIRADFMNIVDGNF